MHTQAEFPCGASARPGVRRRDPRQSFQGIAGGVLLGASRKSWLEALSGAAPEQRLPGSLAAATVGARAGADIVRVHDVAATRQAMDVADALREFK